MVAVKNPDIDGFVARPDPARPVVLVYGPDAGLVSERVNALIKASVDDPNDPFALARLEGDELSAEPSRLVDEAQTMPLFGGRRAVWVKASGRSNIAPAVEALLAVPGIECRVVIEAGDLRPNAPLRALCERARNAAALPCYPDNEKARERLISEEMRSAGLTLTAEAQALLMPLLGGDRAASRSEIAKLALYARGRNQVGVEDVAAVVSDASLLGVEDIVDAAFAGRPAELEVHLAKARTAGTSVGSIFFAAQRQVAQLHKWRVAIEAGAGFSLDHARPPVRFNRKPAIEAALRQWNAARLAAVMAELADAVLESRQTRRNSDLAETIAERALLSIAVKARRSAG
jgi:DNA polymerase III subunit delta